MNVDIGTAKCLKKLGYDYPCSLYGSDDDWDDTIEKEGFWHVVLFHNLFSLFFQKYPKSFAIPTLDEVQKWLREVNNIVICIKPEIYNDGINWLYQIIFIDNIENYNKKSTSSYGDNGEFSSYEECQKNAIQKAINLINFYKVK